MNRKRNNDIENFVKECLFENITLQMAMNTIAKDKNLQNADSETLDKYKESKKNLIFMTARNLRVPENDVKDALADGTFLGLFKKKNKNLTPEMIQKIKDMYKKLDDITSGKTER